MDFIVSRRSGEKPWGDYTGQICFLNQEAADKYLTFIESIEL